jgi:site-specific DNA recombinase
MNKRCALYFRESETEKSGELQVMEMKALAQGRGLAIEAIFDDYGVGPMEDRPQLAQLLKAARANKFDYVVTWRLDRMFASFQQMNSTVKEIQSLGLGFISVRDKIDTTAPNSDLFNQHLEMFTNFNSRIIGERAQAGINGQKRKGCIFGRDRQIDRKKAAELAAQGLKHAEIARRLSCSAGGLSKVLREIKLKQGLGMPL